MPESVVTVASRYSVDETAGRLERALAAKGLKLFAVVDHSGEAEKAGLRMPNTKLFLFGSPKAGTPLMLAAPSIALDLPLKILIREDAEGRVWVSYNNAEFLRERHGIPEGMVKVLAGAGALAGEITG